MKSNLLKELQNLTESYGKCSYEILLEMLHDAAERGKSKIYIDHKEISKRDMTKLQEQGLDVDKIRDEDWDTTTIKISW